MTNRGLGLVHTQEREEHHRVREQLAGRHRHDVDERARASGVDDRDHHAEEHGDEERPERGGEER